MKLYLETTAFNYFFDEERDGHNDTVRLFEEIRAGKHEAFTSGYTYDELAAASEPKRSKMLALLVEYGITLLGISGESNRLASLYVTEGIVPARFRLDGAHIAIASIHGVDCIVSYNFQHINRVKTKLLTERINRTHNYGNAVICTAKEVLDDESEET
jgi:predicted nucleic acid-binding protein